MKINILGSAIGNAAGETGCESAPYKLKKAEAIRALGHDVFWQIFHADHLSEQGVENLENVVEFSSRTARKAFEWKRDNKHIINIGGDHSCAIGFWSGISAASNDDIGLIWVDAHMDAHTFETSESGNIHGMPLAVLLGHGEKKLTHIESKEPKIKPENLCLVGIRSYEEGEAKLLTSLGVKIIFMEEVLGRGIEACMKEAFDVASKAPGGFGLSVDMDGFDTADAPAVGTPVENGIRIADFVPCVENWGKKQGFLALEIAEYNPNFSNGQLKTENSAISIIKAVFPSK